MIWKTDTGRQRRDNEDSAYVRAPLFVVADGMGGAQAGEVASALAVEEFRHALPDDGTPERRLADRIQQANRRIYELSRTQHEHAGMGTTLTAVYVDDSDLAVAHVGDSRAYIFRDHTLTRLTQDHSLVEELVRQGKLTEEQAAEHPQRSIITRALGIELDVEVDTWTYPAREGDVVLLCSDGLTSMIDEHHVAAILDAEPDLQRAAERLIAAANDAGGRDNITVILFRLQDVGGEFVEEPTVVDAGLGPDAGGDGHGRGAPVAGSAATGPSGSGAPSGAITTAPPPPIEERRPRPRLSRTQGRAQSPPPRMRTRSQRLIKPLSALFALLVVLFILGGAGYLATRQLFFIGTNSNGIVTIYDGLPYDLPFGIPMYERWYVSGLPLSAVPTDRRGHLLNHQLRSQNSAVALVRAAEMGQLSP